MQYEFKVKQLFVGKLPASCSPNFLTHDAAMMQIMSCCNTPKHHGRMKQIGCSCSSNCRRRPVTSRRDKRGRGSASESLSLIHI